MATLELAALFVDAVAAVQAIDRPLLVNRDPGPDETGVPIDAWLALEVVDVGADGVDRASVRVWVDGALAFEGGGTPELRSGFDGPGSSVTATADTLRVVLAPTAFFASEAVVAERRRDSSPVRPRGAAPSVLASTSRWPSSTQRASR